jgi:hypothetical protein
MYAEGASMTLQWLWLLGGVGFAALAFLRTRKKAPELRRRAEALEEGARNCLSVKRFAAAVEAARREALAKCMFPSLGYAENRADLAAQAAIRHTAAQENGREVKPEGETFLAQLPFVLCTLCVTAYFLVSPKVEDATFARMKPTSATPEKVTGGSAYAILACLSLLAGVVGGLVLSHMAWSADGIVIVSGRDTARFAVP